MRHTFAHLDQGMLDVAGVLVVLQVFGDLLVREMAPEPSVPPEEKGHEHQQPSGDEKEQAVAGRHAVPGLGGWFCDEIARGCGIGGQEWKYTLVDHVGVEHAWLFQVMGNGVLREERSLQLDFRADPFAFAVSRV